MLLNVEKEALPLDFNGKVKLFICQSGVNSPMDDSFVQKFANEFLLKRPDAQVFGYTE